MAFLIFTPDRDKTRRDYSLVFKPEAEKFARVHADLDCEIHEIDVSKNMAARRRQTMGIVNESGNIDGIAMFMHGWSRGIQCGLRLQDVKAFAEAVADNTQCGKYPEEKLEVILYCCLTADAPGGDKAQQKQSGPGGDGGFADRVRDEFCKVGLPWIEVFAHTTKGHSTRNPYVRSFNGDGSPLGAVDGQWVVRPPAKGAPSPLWKAWRDALWSKGAFERGTFRAGSFTCARKDFRFHVPFMTTEELHSALYDAQPGR